MKVSIPKGTQDFLPADALPRRYVIDRISKVFEAYGFEPLETPAFEKIETLTGKYGTEGEKLIFRILKRGEEGKAGEVDLALRYDLTVPMARVVAMYPELPKPFKRFQIAPVWRAERPQRGRYREFYQCDADVAGSTSPVVEIELLAMAAEVYSSLGYTDFSIQLNHRQVLTGLIHAAGIPADQEIGTLIALDKLDKIGKGGVVAELRERGLNDDQLMPLETLMDLKGTHEEVLAELERLSAGHAGAQAGVANLRVILEGLAGAGAASERVWLNPVLARGLGYYTGAIYEVSLPDFSSSIGAGGRYDNLVGMFSGRQVPACGFSFGLDRMLLTLGERGLLPKSTTRSQVLVPIFSDAVRIEAVRLASELRAAGVRVDVYPDAGKMGNQMQYGSTKGIPFAAIQGPDELANGQVAVRDLRNRAQTLIPRGEVVAYVQSVLAGEVLPPQLSWP